MNISIVKDVYKHIDTLMLINKDNDDYIPAITSKLQNTHYSDGLINNSKLAHSGDIDSHMHTNLY